MTKKNKTLASILLIGGILLGLVWYKLTSPKLAASNFGLLPGWQDSNLSNSMKSFQISCRTLLKQPKDREVGTSVLPLKVGQFIPACQAALELGTNVSNQKLKQFFENWFEVMAFQQHQNPVKGLFTGYYLPKLQGSWQQSERYKFPIYGLPQDLITIKLSDFDIKFGNKKLIGRLKNNTVVPYHTRKDINLGKGKDQLEALLWVDNRIDRFFLEIQGSGYVKMADGKTIMVGYAAQNGHSYVPIGRYLIAKGKMSRENASMQKIRQHLTAHPEEMDEVLHQNPSFIFFNILPGRQALGAQGVPLTPGYSLAVDRKFIPLGLPVWLSTIVPTKQKGKQVEPQRMNRLLVAQDTGGAIKGQVRGDVFWGGESKQVIPQGI